MRAGRGWAWCVLQFEPRKAIWLRGARSWAGPLRSAHLACLLPMRPGSSPPPIPAAWLRQECDVLARHGVQVRVIGNLSLAPAAVQAAAAAVMAATAHHNRAVLNLCFSYT